MAPQPQTNKPTERQADKQTKSNWKHCLKQRERERDDGSGGQRWPACLSWLRRIFFMTLSLHCTPLPKKKKWYARKRTTMMYRCPADLSDLIWMLCLWMSFWFFCSVLPVSLVKENSENQNLGYQQQQQLITVCATGFEMWTFSFVCFLPDDCLSVYCGPNNNLSGFCVNIDLPAYCREKKKGMTILFSFPLIVFYFFFLRLLLLNRFPLLVFSLIFLPFLFPRWRPRGPIL